MPCTRARAEAAIASLPPEKTRFNQGVVGRGAELLSERQKRRIVAMTRHYPWVDWSRVGIGEVAADVDARRAAA